MRASIRRIAVFFLPLKSFHGCQIDEMQGTLQHKLTLEEFWGRFGGKKSNGVGYPREDKLAALKKLAAVVIRYQHQRPLVERREEFERIKSTMHKLYIRRHEICFSCGRPTEARHHLIQLQNGGINCRKNVVSLCNECHAEIHPWLRQREPSANP